MYDSGFVEAKASVGIWCLPKDVLWLIPLSLTSKMFRSLLKSKTVWVYGGQKSKTRFYAFKEGSFVNK